jgi:hypothetical protein
MEGYIALGFTTLIGLAIAAVWKRVANAVQEAELKAVNDDIEKVEKDARIGRENLWKEVNLLKVELAKADAFREAVMNRLDLIQSDLKEIYSLIQKKKDKE